MDNNKIYREQKEFFNKNALEKNGKLFIPNDIFDWYAIKPVIEGMKFIKINDYILDYGCGIGDSIEIYNIANNEYPKKLIGVDIAENAIDEIKKRYREKNYSFYCIKNDLTGLEIEINAAYMIHVLHHANSHKEILQSIIDKLQNKSVFSIVDISSKNPIQELAIFIFKMMPRSIKEKFSDDLLVDGKIPQKLPVNINLIKEILEKNKYKVEINYYGAIFFSLGWFAKLFSIKINERNKIYKLILEVDEWLAQNILKEYSVVYLIKASR